MNTPWTREMTLHLLITSMSESANAAPRSISKQSPRHIIRVMARRGRLLSPKTRWVSAAGAIHIRSGRQNVQATYAFDTEHCPNRLLATAGFPNGFNTGLSLRKVMRTRVCTRLSNPNWPRSALNMSISLKDPASLAGLCDDGVTLEDALART